MRPLVFLLAGMVVGFVLAVAPVASAQQAIGTGAGVTVSGAGGGSGTVAGTAGQVGYFDGATSITSEATGFAWDATNNRLGIGDDTPDGTLGIAAGTLADGIEAVNVTATMPASPTATSYATVVTVTSAGSAAQANGALSVMHGSGYTGAARTLGASFANNASGTGANINAGTFDANFGSINTASGGTAGYNIGSYGGASNSSVLNVGAVGRAATAATSNIGVYGRASGAGTNNIGGLFSLSDSLPSLTTGAIVVDNAAVASPIAVFRDNSTNVVTIADGGSVTMTQNLTVSGTSTKGLKTLAAGTGTVTVLSGAVCVCTDTTAVNAVQCSVSGTTLTINGTGTDVIAWICL